jgi:hypothetical protein
MNVYAAQLAEADDRDYARRLIAARCPEISDMKSTAFNLADADVVPVEVFANVLEVIAALEERIFQLEERSGQ